MIQHLLVPMLGFKMLFVIALSIKNLKELTFTHKGVAMQPFIRDTLLLLALYREATMCNAFAAQQRQLTVKVSCAS